MTRQSDEFAFSVGMWVVERIRQETAQLEADVLRAMSLQDVDKLNRLHIVIQLTGLTGAHVPRAVASKWYPPESEVMTVL